MKGRGAPGSKQWEFNIKGEMIRNQNLASWSRTTLPWEHASCKGSPCPLKKTRRGNPRSTLCRAPIPISWVWDAQDAIKSPTTLATTQTVVLRSGCSTVLWQPTAGKARLPGGCSFRQKQHWKYPASERMGKHPNKHTFWISKKKNQNLQKYERNICRCSSLHPRALGIWR